MNLVFFLEGEGAYTLFDGEVLGKAFVATRPELPASVFDPSTIQVVDFTLDKDWINVRGGAIVRLGGRELVLNVTRTVWARNHPVLTGVSLGTILVFN
jgi:hypothetical protein